MKNARIHLIYFAIIGFLGFQYWTKTQALNEAVGSIVQFDNILKIDNKIIDKTANMIYHTIERNIRAYQSPPNMAFYNRVSTVVSTLEALDKRLEDLKIEFIDFAGGFNKNDTTVLINRSSVKPSRQFFTNRKVATVIDTMTHYLVVLSGVSDYDLREKYIYPKLIYWDRLNKSTVSSVIAQITSLQNQIKFDKISYLNYVNKMVGGTSTGSDFFHVAITPKKAAII